MYKHHQKWKAMQSRTNGGVKSLSVSSDQEDEDASSTAYGEVGQADEEVRTWKDISWNEGLGMLLIMSHPNLMTLPTGKHTLLG